MFINSIFTLLNVFVLHKIMSINYTIIDHCVPVLYKAMLFKTFIIIVYYTYLPQGLLFLDKLPSSLQFFL